MGKREILVGMPKHWTIYIYIYIYICLYIYIYAFILCIVVCSWLYMCIYIYIFMDVYVYICVYIYMNVCIKVGERSQLYGCLLLAHEEHDANTSAHSAQICWGLGAMHSLLAPRRIHTLWLLGSHSARCKWCKSERLFQVCPCLLDKPEGTCIYICYFGRPNGRVWL